MSNHPTANNEARKILQRIRIVKDRLESLEQRLKEVDPFWFTIYDSWATEDVLSRDESLTPAEGAMILERVKREVPADVGINWESIDACIDNYKREKEADKC